MDLIGGCGYECDLYICRWVQVVDIVGGCGCDCGRQWMHHVVVDIIG